MGVIKNVNFQGRLWTDKFGNTYHTVDMYVNGNYIGTTPITYGYGNSYEYTGLDYLKKNGYFPRLKVPYPPPFQFFYDKKIKYSRKSVDVARKKDL